MKTAYLCLFALMLASNSAHADIKSIFTKIADEAQTGNGSTKIEEYDASQKKAAVVAAGKKELEKAYWENCGPWKVITSRKEAIEKVAKDEGSQEKSTVVDMLNKLYDQDKIFAVVGAVSNKEVECSLSWFNFYGNDGTMIKMRYNMGD
jgi:hypothetical protein